MVAFCYRLFEVQQLHILGSEIYDELKFLSRLIKCTLVIHTWSSMHKVAIERHLQFGPFMQSDHVSTIEAQQRHAACMLFTSHTAQCYLSAQLASP